MPQAFATPYHRHTLSASRKLRVHATTADMKTQYLHQRPDWPTLTWDDRAIATQLGRVSHLRGNLLGRIQPLEFDLQQQATLETLTYDVVKTSAIEGEILDLARVRSSVAWHLGIGGVAVPSGDHRIEGIVHVTLDSTQHCDQALTEEKAPRLARRPVPHRAGAEAALSLSAPGASIPFRWSLGP